MFQVGQHLGRVRRGLHLADPEGADQLGPFPHHDGQDHTGRSSTDQRRPPAPGAGAQHGHHSGEEHRGHTEPDHLEVAVQPGGQEDHRHRPADAHPALPQRVEGHQSPQGGAHVDRAAQQEVGEQKPGHTEEGDHGHPGRDARRPSATILGHEDPHHDHQRGDEGRHQLLQHRPDAEEPDPHRVDDGIHRPERVDGQRPSAQGQVPGRHGLPLQHRRGTVGVGEVGPDRRQVQDGGQRGQPQQPGPRHRHPVAPVASSDLPPVRPGQRGPLGSDRLIRVLGAGPDSDGIGVGGGVGRPRNVRPGGVRPGDCRPRGVRPGDDRPGDSSSGHARTGHASCGPDASDGPDGVGAATGPGGSDRSGPGPVTLIAHGRARRHRPQLPIGPAAHPQPVRRAWARLRASGDITGPRPRPGLSPGRSTARPVSPPAGPTPSRPGCQPRTPGTRQSRTGSSPWRGSGPRPR